MLLETDTYVGPPLIEHGKAGTDRTRLDCAGLISCCCNASSCTGMTNVS